MKFQNAHAITSVRHALRLMTAGWDDGTTRTLHTGRGRCYIEVAMFTRSRGEHEESHYWDLAPEVADYLKRDKLVIGKPFWGGRSANEFELYEPVAQPAWYRFCGTIISPHGEKTFAPGYADAPSYWRDYC